MTRVSALGELAASLAHEIRGPLTAILTNAQTAVLLLERSGSVAPSELSDILSDIVRDDRRAVDVITRIRELATKRAPRFEPVDMNEIVTSVRDLLPTDAQSRQAAIELELGPGPMTVTGDRVQLQQVR